METNKISDLFESFERWYLSSEHATKESIYDESLNFENLSNMSKEELIKFFFEFKAAGGGIQSGGHRGKNLFLDYMKKDFEKFKNFILEPFQEEFKVAEWLRSLKEHKNFGKGAATAYLNRINRNKFPIFNDKTKEALRKMGFQVKGAKLEEIYLEVMTIQKRIFEEIPGYKNYYKVDALNHYIIGIEEGVKISDKIFNSSRVPNVWIEKTILKSKPERAKGDKEFSKTLFSPQTGKDGRDTYSLMREVQVGDIVLHFVDNQHFKGVSIVSGDLDDDYSETDPESEFYGKDCYTIALKEYKELDKSISREELFDKEEFKKTLIDLLNSSLKIFYNKKLELNQGAYLTQAPGTLIQILNTIYKRKTGFVIPNLEPWGCYSEKSFWIFQGNPQIYDVKKALGDKAINEWWIKAHKEKIAIGDKGIIWVTGQEGGCFAFFEVTSAIYEKSEDDNQKKYYKQEMKWEVSDKIGIRIEVDISENPILKDSIKDLNWFKDFKGGNQGTTFQMTKQQYDGFFEIAQKRLKKPNYWMIACGANGEYWNEFVELGRVSIGWIELGDHKRFKKREDIEEEYIKVYNPDKRPTNNTLCIWEFSNEIKKGDIVFVKKGRTSFLAAGEITSDTVIYDKDKQNHQMFHNVKWLKIHEFELEDGNVALKALTNLNDYPDFVKKLCLVYLLNTSIDEKTYIKGNNMNKNIIFYGPPGTGKTREILLLTKSFTSASLSNESQNEFLVKIVKNLSWWETIAFALADLNDWASVNEIKQHLAIQAKAGLQNNKTINNTLWGQLQNHTPPGNKFVNTKDDSRVEPFIFEKNSESKWRLIDGWESILPEISENINEMKEKKDEGTEDIRYRLVTFHPGFSYEDFILGIKPDTDEVDKIRYVKSPGKFKEICDIARKNKNKEYAIFIDEINRGNIPAIFGELITLIEDDKRDLEIDIPNSDEPFSVPSNLWIYGTMNTADRSVESLDIALRRRFSFVPFYPKPGVLKGKKVGSIDLEAMLDCINERIEFLKDRDHTIGHSYFLNLTTVDDLRKCFQKRIIPLLEEYFYNDLEKVGLILGEKFVKKKSKHKDSRKFFAKFESDFRDSVDEIDVYFLEDVEEIDEESFVSIYEK